MLVELKYPCIADRYSIAFSIVIGLLTGIMSAIALLYFQEKHYENKINIYYSEIERHYKRIDIGQDNAGDKEIDNMKEQNLGLDVFLTHIKGTHSR